MMEGYVIFSLIERMRSHSTLVYGTLRGFKMYLFPSKQSSDQLRSILLRDHEIARDREKGTRFFIRDTIKHTIFQFDAVSAEDRERWVAELNRMVSTVEECFQDNGLIAKAARTWSMSQKPLKAKKCVIVGDSRIGKTSALLALTKGVFTPEEDVPAVLPVTEHELDGRSLMLFDTPGHPDYDPYRPSLYKGAKLVVICFSMDSRESLRNVTERWRPEIQHHCDAPFVLVGLKADLARDMGDSSSCSSSPLSDRGEEEQQAEGESAPAGSVSATSQSSALSHEELQDFAEHMGMLTYSVCSARQPDSCKAAFRIVYAVASMTKKLRAGNIHSEADPSDFDLSEWGSDGGSNSTPTHMRNISRDGEDDTFKGAMTPTPVHMSHLSRDGDLDELLTGPAEHDFRPLPPSSGFRSSGDFSSFTNPLSVHVPTPIRGRRRGSSVLSNNSNGSMPPSSTGSPVGSGERGGSSPAKGKRSNDFLTVSGAGGAPARHPPLSPPPPVAPHLPVVAPLGGAPPP